MDITLKSNSIYELVVIAENVHVREDIEERTYQTKEDGRTDFSTGIREIKTDALERIANVLYDMIEHRIAEFDSSELINSLFEKLPPHVRSELIKEIAQH